VLASLFLEMEPPRLGRDAEKFLSALPVSSLWTSRLGQLTVFPSTPSACCATTAC